MGRNACTSYAGKIEDIIYGSDNCFEISLCLFENLSSAINITNSTYINIIKSQFVDIYYSGNIQISLSNCVCIKESCFFRCSVGFTQVRLSGVVIRIQECTNISLSDLSLFGCYSSLETIESGNYIIHVNGDEGSLFDSNSTFNRIFLGPGPGISVKTCYLERFQLIGCTSCGLCSYVSRVEKEPFLKKLLFANNIKSTLFNSYGISMFRSSAENANVNVVDSHFLYNEYPLIFESITTQLISTNNLLSCSMSSSNLIKIVNNKYNQNGQYSIPIKGKYVGCIGIKINHSAKILNGFLLSILALNLLNSVIF